MHLAAINSAGNLWGLLSSPSSSSSSAAAATQKPLQLSLANKIWVEKTFPLEPQFLDWTTKYYKSPVQPADFINATEEERVIILSTFTASHLPHFKK